MRTVGRGTHRRAACPGGRRRRPSTVTARQSGLHPALSRAGCGSPAGGPCRRTAGGREPTARTSSNRGWPMACAAPCCVTVPATPAAASRRSAAISFLRCPIDGLHRFLPALARREGYDVAYVDVVDRPRHAGTSKLRHVGSALDRHPRSHGRVVVYPPPARVRQVLEVKRNARSVSHRKSATTCTTSSWPKFDRWARAGLHRPEATSTMRFVVSGFGLEARGKNGDADRLLVLPIAAACAVRLCADVATRYSYWGRDRCLVHASNRYFELRDRRHVAA